MSYQIILVDDHVMIRTALKEMIQKSGPYQILAEYSNGAQLVEAFPFQTSPDLLILDLNMPNMNGMQVLDWMHEQNLSIKTLILTLEDNEDWIIKLFRRGIRGYLKKNCPASELKRAIDDILQFGYYHNDVLTRALVTETPENPEQIKLTERQLKFLELICQEEEYTYEQIASMMDVSLRTVNGYRESLFERFGVKSKTGLVLYAIKNRLIAF